MTAARLSHVWFYVMPLKKKLKSFLFVILFVTTVFSVLVAVQFVAFIALYNYTALH